jgi:uncharacterized repeat protein (TIGR03803 family)
MKTKLLILILICFFSKPVLNAQTMELWGTTTHGGANGDGTIFKADASGNNLQPVYSFIDSLGAVPIGKLLYTTNGDFYGVTAMGGFDDSCVIHKYNPSTGVYTKIYDLFLDKQFGYGAQSGMIQASNGMLYGLCSSGGANNYGVIYKIDPANDIYTDIYDFSHALGGNPMGSLVQATNGLLYGFTYNGGSNDKGVIFSFDPVSNSYTKVQNFYGPNGRNPSQGSLIQATNGILYGMTYIGGAFGKGVIYSYDITADICTKIYDFDGPNGAYPYGGLIQASNGLLYGMTSEGGVNNFGVMFSYDINSNAETVLLDFNGSNGKSPTRGLTQGSTGKLFGATSYGGSQANGVAFSYDITASTYTKLIDFSPAFAMPSCEFTEAPTGAATGVIVVQGNSIIDVFPVPATNSLYLSDIQAGEIIRFFDVAGREFDSRQSQTSGKFQLDISLFPELFFLRTENGTVKKVVRIN